MSRVITKKVRLSRDEQRKLARLAKRRRTSESDVLRQGLLREERYESRKRAVERLITWAEEEKRDWKRPDIDVPW